MDMEKSHVSALLRRNMGTHKGHLLLLLLAAVFLTSLLMGSTGSAATLWAFQSPISPISPISPVISPPEPVAGPTATPAPQPAAPPSAASTLVLWVVIGLVVVGAFVVGLVFFHKRRG
jgi:beta-lactamase regulating signal transducer with metallopeptidase domain